MSSGNNRENISCIGDTYLKKVLLSDIYAITSRQKLVVKEEDILAMQGLLS
jgi:hypothetical protein